MKAKRAAPRAGVVVSVQFREAQAPLLKRLILQGPLTAMLDRTRMRN